LRITSCSHGGQSGRSARGGIDPQARAQSAHRARCAERALAGGEVIQHHAEREQVAARIVADELHLLGRHVGPGSHRQRELFLEQVGQVLVARQAVVHQHGRTVGAEHDVAGLDVQVHHMLSMQVVQRGGHADADLHHLVERQRRLGQARAQRVAGDVLHHDERLAREVAARHVARHVLAGERRHDHLLDFVADDRGRILAALDARHLHDQRRLVGDRRRAAFGVDTADAPHAGHAALVQALLEQEAVDDSGGARLPMSCQSVPRREPPPPPELNAPLDRTVPDLCGGDGGLAGWFTT
jgi:hypothetical protein